MLALPTYSDAAEAHADWVEYRVLTSTDRFTSWVSHQRDLNLAGTLDVGIGDGHKDDERLEALMADVIAELGDRERHCGESDNYPFVIDSGGLGLKDAQRSVAYRFQLLLALLGKDAAAAAGAEPGDRLFEDLCAESLFHYLGGGSEPDRLVFGFPRRILPADFRGAVDALSERIGEGQGVIDVPESSNQKDAFLDVVAWRSFPDGRIGKLIIFGQCATGANWKGKYRDLRPDCWCKAWMSRAPAVTPIAAFFIPHRPERDYWRRTNIYAGIVFDRCRVAAYTRDLETDLEERLEGWVAKALSCGQRP